MQYVKERDEIEIFGSVVFRRGDLEGCVSRNAILPRVHSCLLKRTGMEVISDETRLWKRLCHEPRLRTLFRIRHRRLMLHAPAWAQPHQAQAAISIRCSPHIEVEAFY